MAITHNPDFTVSNHGSIVILNAHTQAAKDWVEEYITDDAQTWGPHGIVVEPRYIAAITDGIEADGLVVV